MKSHMTDEFRDAFTALPPEVQQQARAAYVLFQDTPHHPSLHFKRLRSTQIAYTVRVGLHYRALAYEEQGELYWFWIGSHATYDQLVKQL